MQTRSSTSTLIALTAIAFLLTGCTAHSADDAAKKPAASATAPEDIEKAPYENACDGTQAVVSGDGGTHELEDCDVASIVSSGSTITLGATKKLMVEGSNNAITVTGAENVTLLGADNAVSVKDGSPEVDDQGTGNTVR